MHVDAPPTTDFQGWQFALSNEALDCSWMQSQKIRDFDYHENLSALRHSRGPFEDGPRLDLFRGDVRKRLIGQHTSQKG